MPLKKYGPVESLLTSHTTALDAIAKDVKDWNAVEQGAQPCVQLRSNAVRFRNEMSCIIRALY
jgi:hypothetical protein